MAPRIWVHRLPRGTSGGNPRDDNCPLVDVLRIHNAWREPANPLLIQEGDTQRITYFVLNEVYTNDCLRQGWGIPGLDLRQPEKKWVENYVIAAWTYWGEKMDAVEPRGCALAMGRRHILERMLEMQPGDVVLLPKMHVTEKRASENHFSVVTVTGKYQFEDRSHKPHTWEKDFGHQIGVHKIKVYDYSDETLRGDIFGAPYRHAIDEVRPHHGQYKAIEHFVQCKYMSPLRRSGWIRHY